MALRNQRTNDRLRHAGWIKSLLVLALREDHAAVYDRDPVAASEGAARGRGWLVTRIGMAISTQRKACQMQQKVLAAQAEISPQYLCDIELGKRLPPFDTVLDIANAFPDVDSTAWLFLLLSDLWGPSVAMTMRAWAARQPDEPATTAAGKRGTDG